MFNILYKEHLSVGYSYYTPCLGSAQCLANIKFVDVYNSEDMEANNIGTPINTAVTSKHKVCIEEDKAYHRESMPVTMTDDRHATYSHVVFNPDGESIWIQEGFFTRVWNDHHVNCITWLN